VTSFAVDETCSNSLLGTGKTTVAKLYGKMLKEFGFLSDGGFVMVTPSDLKGSAVGEGGERTKTLLDGAKGKVVFIDEAYNLDPARHIGSYGAEVFIHVCFAC
jgi:AAA+ superfamily predicted ATPase